MSPALWKILCVFIDWDYRDRRWIAAVLSVEGLSMVSISVCDTNVNRN